MQTATAIQPTDKAKAESLRILAGFAKTAGLDLNASSEQMFRCSPDQLTKPQRLELLRMFLRAQPKPETHDHFCVECGARIICDKTGCDTDEGECRRCHEGIMEGEIQRDIWLNQRYANAGRRLTQ
jgi:hypothetical protein